MIRPINVSDTSFQAKGLKLRQAKKVSRQILDVSELSTKQSNVLKGIAKTPVRLGMIEDEILPDACVGSGQASLVFTALGCLGMTSS